MAKLKAVLGRNEGPGGRKYGRDLVTSNQSMGFFHLQLVHVNLHRLPCSKEAKLQHFMVLWSRTKFHSN